ncbi:hypothetical protein A6A28_32580 [Streptomyces sp. CB03578]|nr:hypothetical protein A6A28_32580 [Streptomyces sp. CB03578]
MDAGRVGARLWILIGHRLQQPAQVGRQFVGDLGRAQEMSRTDFHGCSPVLPVAGERFEEGDPQRVYVASRTCTLPEELLGRHVGKCADQGVGCTVGVVACGSGESEVREVREAVLTQQYVGRLHVVVDDAVGVYVVEGRGDLNTQPKRLNET